MRVEEEKRDEEEKSEWRWKSAFKGGSSETSEFDMGLVVNG